MEIVRSSETSVNFWLLGVKPQKMVHSYYNVLLSISHNKYYYGKFLFSKAYDHAWGFVFIVSDVSGRAAWNASCESVRIIFNFMMFRFTCCQEHISNSGANNTHWSSTWRWNTRCWDAGTTNQQERESTLRFSTVNFADIIQIMLVLYV
jgi:hypothetical protein